MTRRMNAWMWMLLLAALAGCTSFQREAAEVSRDQWEPEVETASAAK
jgi:hypothetical protein